MCIRARSLLLLFGSVAFGSKSVVLFSDLIELLHVLEEVRTSLKSDEQLGLLAVSVASWTLHSDGSRSDLLERGIVVSRIKKIKEEWLTYRTKFSDAITLVETAFPSA